MDVVHCDVPISRYFGSLTNISSIITTEEVFLEGFEFPLYLYRSLYLTGFSVATTSERLYATSILLFTENMVPEKKNKVLDNGQAYLLI